MNPDPIAFTVGPFVVRWYGLLIATAILIGIAIASREVERQGIDLDHFYNVILVAIPCGLIGARLFYVIFRWDYYGQNPIESFMIWKGGLAIHGALIGGLLAGYAVARYYRLPFLKLADIAAPCLILGQAIGRWGNYFNQEAYGYPTDLPWAMYIAGAYRHPTFLYESLWNVCVFLFLLWLRRRENIRTGDVFLAYVVGYSMGRFVIEGFRTDSLMFGPYRAAQLVSIAAIIAAALYRFWWQPRHAGKLEALEEGVQDSKPMDS
ncbi:MAG: prolipoprotein diacylglyceryl transferase [bacterium]|jgi:phosphatidylglycerol:prolipoprotein diacylglycerol transferase|nr:prolipoprotein diacylglyceryl transferase [Bacillota bacterium]HHW54644.1 prolipoprotein diacylglyceryl transferase [Bacillota bacterium]